MARALDDTTEQYLEIDTGIVTVPPFTLACWFRTDDVTLRNTLIFIGDKDITWKYHALRMDGDRTNDPIAMVTSGATTSKQALTSTGASANTWHHACGIVAADDDRRAFIDGGSKGTETTDCGAVANVNRTSIGRMGDSSPTYYLSGQIAEAAIWNAALLDAEVAILAHGFSPLFVRPQSLVAYWPLIRTEDQDRVGGHHVTPYNSPTVTAHPPVLYPAPPGLYAPPAAAIPPGWWRHMSMTGVATQLG